MNQRRFLAVTLTPILLVVGAVAAYLAVNWPEFRLPSSPPLALPTPRPDPAARYDGTEPFALTVQGMPGIRMYLDPRDLIITWTILHYGSWEPAETDLFIRTIRPGDTVVDAGANVGYYTIIASRLVGPAGRVYAFEPDPANFELLRRNVELNGLTNVVLEPKALSDLKGAIKLFLAPENKGDHRIYQPKGESRPSVDVEAVRLDDYFKGLGRRVDVVKSDTQGAEGLILEGMTGLLEGRSDGPTIFMEFWPHALVGLGTDAGVLLNKLRSHGYKFYEIHKSGLPRVEPADLLAAHSVDDSASQTDLLLLRGGREPPTEPKR
jgi:FkbM family methyltransferase